MPLPSNIATPTIFRGKASTIFAPDQKTSLPCPYPQTSPHPRYVGARHSQSLHQTKRLRCLAPTLKHRHTHDLSGQGIHNLCTRSKDFAALPLPSNIATPTICRGKAFTIFAPDQKTSLPCPECRQRIPHPRSFGARHSQSLHQIKRLRCLAPTLKHRHTHDLSGQGIHNLCTKSKDFAALPLPSNIATPTIFRGKARPSLYQTKSDDCPYPQTSPHPRSFGARHDHLCTRPKAMIAPTLKHRHTHDL
ncbi:hypothetical protein [Microseira wollei]|uniref:Uncharacterized protein n=1 Tax=Microseira wollei NIES-4236 TaxID=2530354 RepID=A0AAV3XAQ9_9CYAN|nr:hypothetical protein [Microseira wollei]GET38481.1 hypothetical protein MiSe_32390 [Microseira wollei NIES-4236]